jgi:hypothetical protein
MEDPRESFFTSVKVEGSNVNLLPPTILLFGGLTDLSEPPINSLRSHIVDYCLVKRSNLSDSFILPEDYKDWAQDAIYPDLLEFETHIAQMSTSLIIIPESAGSIAELGAFAVNEHVREKLLVILPEKYFESDSFIKLGLLRQLNDEQIFSYDFDPEDVTKNIDDFVEHIANDISTFVYKGDATEQFNPKNFGHVAFTIFQIIIDCRAIKLTEIKSFANTLGIEINTTDLKKILFLLHRLSFIDKKRSGPSYFYTSHRINPDVRLNYARKIEDIRIDKTVFRINLDKFYTESSDEYHRRKALGIPRSGKNK